MSKYIIKNCPCFNEGHPKLVCYGECLSLVDDIAERIMSKFEIQEVE